MEYVLQSGARSSIVVTGVGAVSPIGVGTPVFTRSLRNGAPGVALLDDMDGDCRSTVAARCNDFAPTSVMPAGESRRLPRLVPMALAACREAMAQAGLLDAGGEREGALLDHLATHDVGLFLGTGGGGIDFTLDQAKAQYTGGKPSLWTITNATHGNLAGELSIRLGLQGPSLCSSTGCASSSDAVGLAMELLRSGRSGSPNIMIVVGADAHIRWETLRGMELLGVITTKNWRDCGEDPATASRPFDVSRDGFILGEGAWAVVLERADVARARERAPLATMLGYGATCDAHHRVRPAPDMAQCARAILQAVDDAAIRPDQIEVAQLHGTGTRLNDELETRAIRAAFGVHADALACSSIKAMIGHPQGASGLAGLVATIASLGNMDAHEEGPFVPPTINLREQDPACGLHVTPNLRQLSNARTALVNCLAFGARNSALVVRIEREAIGDTNHPQA